MDELAEGLKVLAQQVKGTTYRDVMKLLRLLLSGLQVSHPTLSSDSVVQYRPSYQYPDIFQLIISSSVIHQN